MAAFAQNNRGLVFNKDLKVLVGSWAGNMVYTDFTKNNTQVTLPTRLQVVDLKDSLAFIFYYTETGGKEIADSSTVCIYEREDKLSIDGELYDIVSTGRRGIRLIIVAEKQGFDNNKVADLRQTVTFGPSNLNILKEVRYLENEFYFIRNRSAFIKK